MSNPMLTKSRTAEGAIAPWRIVAHGTADGSVKQASAATSALTGVNDMHNALDGERVDVHLLGLVEVEFGGAVAAGALLTSDADGCAVVATPAAGASANIIGRAEVAGVKGDIGLVLLAPGVVSTPAAP